MEKIIVAWPYCVSDIKVYLAINIAGIPKKNYSRLAVRPVPLLEFTAGERMN